MKLHMVQESNLQPSCHEVRAQTLILPRYTDVVAKLTFSQQILDRLSVSVLFFNTSTPAQSVVQRDHTAKSNLLFEMFRGRGSGATTRRYEFGTQNIRKK